MTEPRTARSRKTREKLVEATQIVLREAGTFTPEAIAESADCSVATFFAHFATKDDALVQAFQLTADELMETVVVWLDINVLHDIGFEKLSEEFARQAIAFYRREVLTFRVGHARMLESKMVRDAYRALDAAVLDHMAAFVKAGQDEGIFLPGDPFEVAGVLLALSQSMFNPRALRLDLPEDSIKRLGAAARAVFTG